MGPTFPSNLPFGKLPIPPVIIQNRHVITTIDGYLI